MMAHRESPIIGRHLWLRLSAYLGGEKVTSLSWESCVHPPSDHSSEPKGLMESLHKSQDLVHISFVPIWALQFPPLIHANTYQRRPGLQLSVYISHKQESDPIDCLPQNGAYLFLISNLSSDGALWLKLPSQKAVQQYDHTETAPCYPYI